MFANFLSLTGWPVHHSFSLQNYFARNFYNMRMLALFVAFAINFILLFYKVCVCVSLGVRDRSKSPMTPMDRFPWELRRSQFTPILNCTLTKERAQSSVPSQMPRKAGCMCFWESKWNLSWLWLKRAPCCGGFAPSVPRIIQLNFLLVMMPGCDMTLFG